MVWDKLSVCVLSGWEHKESLSQARSNSKIGEELIDNRICSLLLKGLTTSINHPCIMLRFCHVNDQTHVSS